MSETEILIENLREHMNTDNLCAADFLENTTIKLGVIKLEHCTRISLGSQNLITIITNDTKEHIYQCQDNEWTEITSAYQSIQKISGKKLPEVKLSD